MTKKGKKVCLCVGIVFVILALAVGGFFIAMTIPNGRGGEYIPKNFDWVVKNRGCLDFDLSAIGEYELKIVLSNSGQYRTKSLAAKGSLGMTEIALNSATKGKLLITEVFAEAMGSSFPNDINPSESKKLKVADIVVEQFIINQADNSIRYKYCFNRIDVKGIDHQYTISLSSGATFTENDIVELIKSAL